MTDEICTATKNDGEPCTYTAKYDDGKCGIHTEANTQGRPSKFDEARDDLLEAADGFLNLKQVANKGGISRSTLYKYLDEKPTFSDTFKRARGRAADRLVTRALDPDDDIDVQFARFLLERSFKFIKTERQEVDLDADHSFDASQGVTAEFVSYEETHGE
jgi:hypothetical protein